jgi:hypothetical protein
MFIFGGILLKEFPTLLFGLVRKLAPCRGTFWCDVFCKKVFVALCVIMMVIGANVGWKHIKVYN